MRFGFVLVCLVSSGIVLACGGSVLTADDEGGSPPETADGASGTTRLAYCTELATAAKNYFACTNQSPSGDYYDDIVSGCEHRAMSRPRCAAEFRALTLCQARELNRCELESDSNCDPEGYDYIECVSGGSCNDLGGASHDEEVFTTHDVCECVGEVRPSGAPPVVPPGGACTEPVDCGLVCCPCSPEGEYSAAMCDKSAGRGRCATAEETCAATAWRCDEMLASESVL